MHYSGQDYEQFVNALKLLKLPVFTKLEEVPDTMVTVAVGESILEVLETSVSSVKQWLRAAHADSVRWYGIPPETCRWLVDVMKIAPESGYEGYLSNAVVIRDEQIIKLFRTSISNDDADKTVYGAFSPSNFGYPEVSPGWALLSQNPAEMNELLSTATTENKHRMVVFFEKISITAVTIILMRIVHHKEIENVLGSNTGALLSEEDGLEATG